MISELPEKFLCGVAGAVLAEELQRAERVIVPEFFAQQLGQIRHRLPIGHALDVEPVHELLHTIDGLLPRSELGFEFFAGQGFDVGRHGKECSRWKRIPKGETQRGQRAKSQKLKRHEYSRLPKAGFQFVLIRVSPFPFRAALR